MRLRVLLLAVALVAGTACGGGGDDTVDLGLRKVTLDLSFKAKGGAPPSLTQIIGAQEPYAPSSQALGNELGPIGPFSGINLATACPVAPLGLVPEVPVQGTVTKPPEPGTYLSHVKGTYDLSGPVSLKGDFFPVGAMEIANVTDVDSTDPITGPFRTISYDVIERNILSSTTTHYESITRDITRTEVRNAPHQVASELVMISTKTTAAGSTTTFTPNPPITVMQYGGEGSEWTSAGIDQDTNTAMVVQGTITARESVDVCGKMIDTFRIESVERIANPVTGYVSETNAATGNVYSVATQFGGLMVRKVVDTTSTFNVSGGGAKLVVKSTSTLDSVTPYAKPKPAA